ncbi:hypothetical protein PHLCEN_2v6473 [Hermanssonia centrifuga]|uniref:Major facilitator superfamily (MFS) profile domain-containing protein n=1 Tax=Hermanssonia centrifuga TaxID=98765 RepID=A0A2R6NZ87_9APHY|nr:hypothetical protein PHLCEN_2v6473 [Hermanssonia centrifuga]
MLTVALYRILKAKWENRHGDTDAANNNDAPQPEAPNPRTPPSTSSQREERGDSSTKWTIMLMVALAIPVFLETLDYTVVATAQVHIASVFNRLDLQSYIGTIYLLTSTVFLPPFGSLADIFGRHVALQVSLLIFMIGSAISTGSQNMATMLAGRGVAGIGAAGLLAVVRIILTDSNSLNANNWQQSMLFLLYTIGYCLGPFIGGELISVSFRWIFAINLPCCAVAGILGFFLLRGRTKGSQPSQRLPSTQSHSKMQSFVDKLLRVDWIGAALFMAGGILVLLALNWGSNEKWNSVKVVVCFVLGGILIVAFLGWEYVLEMQEESPMPSSIRLFHTDPMIPLALFRSLDVCIVQYGTFVSGMIMLVMFYFVAIFFIIVTGLSPTKSGVQLIYFAPGMGGGSLISIQLIKLARQPKYPIILGAIVCTVALGLISMGMDQNKENLVNGFMAMAGVGTGLSIGPLAIHARFSQPEDRVAIVSALSLFFRAFGGTVGLAQCGAVLNGKVNSYITEFIRSGAISSSDAAALSSASSSSSLSSLNGISSLPPDIQAVVREAFRQGTRYAFISLIPWCALAAILSLFLSKIRDRNSPRAESDSEAPEQEIKEEKIGALKEDVGDVAVPPLHAGDVRLAA